MGEDEEANDSPNNFNNKSVWARISVIAAGPVFNFILAFIFAVIITAMVGYDKPVIGAVESGYPAAEAGLKKGDEIVQMGNKKIHINAFVIVIINSFSILSMVLKTASHTTPERIFLGTVHFM